GKESDVLAPVREKNCCLQCSIARRQYGQSTSSHFVPMAVKTVEHTDAPTFLQPGNSCEFISHAGRQNQASGSVDRATGDRNSKFVTGPGRMSRQTVGERDGVVAE